MDIFKEFATDAQAEVTGTWVTISEATGARLLIARSGNRVHANAMQRLYKENRLGLEDKDTEKRTALDEQLSVDAVAEGILKGWEGISYKGQPLEFSVENAKMLLQHGDFRALVLAHSRDFDLYRAKLESEAKNG